jgi:ABC-2 type transport system ATP-binding protein
MAKPLLVARDLRKSFGALTAVDGVSLSIHPGEIVGLLGPNGAGKTTTVSMLCGLVPPDGGEVTIDGRAFGGDADPLRRSLGLVPQDLALYDELSARANLSFFGALYGLKGRDFERAMMAALTFVGLAERANDRVQTFSGGMKRRLNLAAGMLHDPSLVLLDEPTVGVDPQSRNAIFDNLEELRRRGKSLLYTTHYMEEAERLCDRIVILDHGRVIAEDDVRGLLRRLPAANRLRLDLVEPFAEATASALLAETRALPGVAAVELAHGILTLGLTSDADLAATSAAALKLLTERGLACESISTERGTLEAVFLELTGRNLRDE